MSPLNWMHHTLIQALLSRGPMEEKEFFDMFSGVTGRNPGLHKKVFDDALLKINKELAYVKFELRGCRNQYDGKVYYGVVNTVSDEQSKLGTRYSIPQIAFYRAVLDAIMQDTTAHGSISCIDALNLQLDSQASQISNDSTAYVPAAFKSFTMAQKEKTLQELIQDRWLSPSSDGNIGLGVRSFLDLKGWFRNNDVPSCDLCNEAAIKAEVCNGEGCDVRFHSYCLKNSHRKVSMACSCGAPWNFSSNLENEGNNGDPSRKTENQECKPELRENSTPRGAASQRDAKNIRSPEVRLTRRSRRA
ncbi:embryo defective 1379 isoform X2 [Wolffia australiana]